MTVWPDGRPLMKGVFGGFPVLYRILKERRCEGKMGIKRVLAAVLAATMVLGSAMGVSADVTSPHGSEIPSGTEKEVHSDSNVYRSDDGDTILKVDTKENVQDGGVVLEGQSTIGDGVNPVIVGDGLSRVRIKSTSVVKKNAFKDTKVKYIICHKGVTFEDDSLKNAGKVTITLKNKTALKGFKAKGKANAKKLTVKTKKRLYKKLTKKQKNSLKKQIKKIGGKLKLV
jgi:hypothetical protein